MSLREEELKRNKRSVDAQIARRRSIAQVLIAQQ